MDKGLYSETNMSIMKSFSISNTQVGFIATSYTIGHLFASIFFGMFYNKCKPLILLGFGLAFWIICVVAFAISPSYEIALGLRFLIGIAEGADIVILPMLMNRIAPKGRESVWLGSFFISNVVGVSTGSSFGGFWEDEFKDTPFGLEPWRTAYIFNACLMVPFVLICFCGYGRSDLMYLKSSNDGDYAPLAANDVTAPPDQKPQPRILAGARANPLRNMATKPPVTDGIRLLMTNGLYVCIILGPFISLLCTGAYGVFIIKFVIQLFGLSKLEAAGIVSTINMVSGGIGTFFGGLVTDLLRTYRAAHNSTTSSIHTALLVPFAVTCIGAPAYTINFLLLHPSQQTLFWVCNCIGTLSFTICPAPTMSAIMWHTDKFAGALGISFYMVATNIGMSVSPPLFGKLLDMQNATFPNDAFKQGEVFCYFTGLLYVSLFFRFLAWVLSWRLADDAAKFRTNASPTPPLIATKLDSLIAKRVKLLFMSIITIMDELIA